MGMQGIIGTGMQSEIALRSKQSEVTKRDGRLTAQGLQEMIAVAERELHETGGQHEKAGVISQGEMAILKEAIDTAKDSNLKPVKGLPDGDYVKELKLDRGYNQVSLFVVDGDVFLQKRTQGINPDPDAAITQTYQLT